MIDNNTIGSKLAQLITVLTEPGRVFDDLKQRPGGWLPAVLTLVGTLALAFLFFQKVDAAWMVDQIVAAKHLPADQQDAVRHVLSGRTLQAMSVGSVVVIVPATFVLMALYWWLAGKVMGGGGGVRRFGEWFAFYSWSSVPALLSLVIGLIATATMQPQTLFESVKLTHVDPIFVHLALDNPWHSLAASFDLLMFWTITLTTIGWQRWTGQGVGRAVFVSVLPYALLYGTWALIVALSQH